MTPLDSPPVATILRTERSRRSITTDEKCHPRSRHRSAAWDGSDSALDSAADCDALCNDGALDLRASQLAFDSAENLRWTIAIDLADDGHVGTDARGHSRFVVGSDLVKSWSCGCTVPRMTSAAFAATFLSLSDTPFFMLFNISHLLYFVGTQCKTG
jgi:hypothetical protein